MSVEKKQANQVFNSNDDENSGRQCTSSSDNEETDTYTVDEAVNKIGFGLFQILITVFCGLLLVADSMEFMILSILSPLLKCQWQLSTIEEAAVTSVVFLGLLIGVLFWGFLNDLIGRKTSLLLVDICILVFGLLSAAQISRHDSRIPGYPWVLICRFGVGFSAGGTIQVVTYYIEFLPKKRRGIWLVAIALWWVVGAMFSAALAILVLGVYNLNWHWYLGLSALPLAIVLILFPFVPESARFYLVKGKTKEAQKVIEKIARMNCKKCPSGRLVVQEDAIMAEKVKESKVLPDILRNGTDHYQDNRAGEDSQLSDAEASNLLEESYKSRKRQSKAAKLSKGLSRFSLLFEKGMWQTTIILFFLWFGGAWSHYGMVLLTTTLLTSDPHCGPTRYARNSSLVCQEELDTDEYVRILMATAAEIPGLILTFLIIDILGRKKTMALEYLLAAGSFLLLLICTSKTGLTIFLFIVRAFVAGVLQVVYVYTPEVYSTEVRALGLGVCNVAARIGGILTPVVAQVVFDANDYASISLYAGSCIVFAVMSLLLPIETKGRPLKDK